MSGIFKSVGKVFKKVTKFAVHGVIGTIFPKIGKVIGKVLPFALAAAAVVFTGGAALPAMPSFLGAGAAGGGGMLAGLGLSPGLTSALTSVVTQGAIGGLLGGKQGALMGAVSGLAGGIMPTAAGAAGLGGVGTAAGGGVASSAMAASPIFSGIGSAVAPASGGGGLFGGNPQLMASLFGGLSQSFAPDPYKQAAKAKAKADMKLMRKRSEFLYGSGDDGTYSGDNPFGEHEKDPPPDITADSYYRAAPKVRWEFDPASNKVVETHR